jgi:hypothetical protein
MRTGILFATVLAIVSLSQADEIAEIRDYYNQVKEALEEGSSGLYTTELSINTGDIPFSAVGVYREEITFYWGDEAGYSWLVLVTWTSEYAAMDYHGEALYRTSDHFVENSEEVVFQFLSLGMGDEIMFEERWWFDDGRVIQSSGRDFTSGNMFEYTPNDGADTDELRNHRNLLELFRAIRN